TDLSYSIVADNVATIVNVDLISSYLSGSSGTEFYFGPDLAGLNGGTGATVAATHNNWYTIQGVIGTSGVINLNGTETVVNSGAGTASTALRVGTYASNANCGGD